MRASVSLFRRGLRINLYHNLTIAVRRCQERHIHAIAALVHQPAARLFLPILHSREGQAVILRKGFPQLILLIGRQFILLRPLPA